MYLFSFYKPSSYGCWKYLEGSVYNNVNAFSANDVCHSNAWATMGGDEE